MSETLHRQWSTLRMVPRYPGKISVDQIHSRLRSEGFDITIRTVQRDLNNLSVMFPIVNDDSNKPYGWSWSKDAKVLDIPGMDRETAFTFGLAEIFLGNILPPDMRTNLKPHFTQAHHILSQSPLRRWSRSVRLISQGQPLKAPSIKPSVVQAVYEALLSKRQLAVRYRSRVQNDAAKTAQINVLGLVFRDSVAYLVSNFQGYGDIRLLAVHRLQEAKVTEEPAVFPQGFDLDIYIAEGNLNFSRGETIQLEANFNVQAAYHLGERKLSDDQKLVHLSDGQVKLTATVANTHQLRWWLLGFGASVEIVKPIALRELIAAEAKKMAALYSID